MRRYPYPVSLRLTQEQFDTLQGLRRNLKGQIGDEEGTTESDVMRWLLDQRSVRELAGQEA